MKVYLHGNDEPDGPGELPLPAGEARVLRSWSSRPLDLGEVQAMPCRPVELVRVNGERVPIEDWASVPTVHDGDVIEVEFDA